jgi:membrane-bound lytic murein transglycosylase B
MPLQRKQFDRRERPNPQPRRSIRTPRIARRSLLAAGLGAVATFVSAGTASAQASALTFQQWVERFRPRARARGVSEATYHRVMGHI